jgi:hypothetical protein
MVYYLLSDMSNKKTRHLMQDGFKKYIYASFICTKTHLVQKQEFFHN